jgi:hypothetical protein
MGTLIARWLVERHVGALAETPEVTVDAELQAACIEFRNGVFAGVAADGDAACENTPAAGAARTEPLAVENAF